MNPETTEQHEMKASACLTRFLIVVLIFVAIIAVSIPTSLSARRPAWQSRAKGTLRSIGSAELAFKEQIGNGMYGTFDQLKEELYIAEGYTMDNFIEGYSLVWEVDEVAPDTDTYHPSSGISTFTVVAYPDPGMPRSLHTFAVTEDQIVRQYTPENGNEIGSVKTWDPIL